MWMLWLKINIQRSTVKRQKDRDPLLQAVVRQRRSYYPYTPSHFDPCYTTLQPRVVVILQPRVVVTPRDSNPKYLVTDFVVDDSLPGSYVRQGLQAKNKRKSGNLGVKVRRQRTFGGARSLHLGAAKALRRARWAERRTA